MKKALAFSFLILGVAYNVQAEELIIPESQPEIVFESPKATAASLDGVQTQPASYGNRNVPQGFQPLKYLGGVGVGAGLFIPASEEMRGIIGDRCLSFYLKRMSCCTKKNLNFGIELGSIAQSTADSSLLVLAPQIAATHYFDLQDEDTVPYVSLKAGLSYIGYDLTNPTAAVDGVARLRSSYIGWSAAAEIGCQLFSRFNVSARYDLLPVCQNLVFNGFSFELAYQICKF